jgi:hypothetical protein
MGAIDGTIGSRLKHAIGAWDGGGISAMQRELQAEGVPGSSYAMVHKYLRDKSVPPLAFLTAAADLLGVRVSWLAFGEGRRTEEGQALAAAALSSPEEFAMLRGISRWFPAIERADPWDRGAVLRTTRACLSFFVEVEARVPPTPAAFEDLAHEAGKSVGAALNGALLPFVRQQDLDDVALSVFLPRATEAVTAGISIARLTERKGKTDV